MFGRWLVNRLPTASTVWLDNGELLPGTACEEWLERGLPTLEVALPSSCFTG